MHYLLLFLLFAYLYPILPANFILPVVVSGHVQQSAIFVSFLVAVSPILKTLTESISTDTIWAMTVSLSHSTHHIHSIVAHTVQI